MVKLKKKGGYIRKHRNKWEYRESIGKQGTTTTNNILYYTNTNEIPGELSHENLVSSHVKISPWLHNKSRISHQVLLRHCCFSLLTEEDYP